MATVKRESVVRLFKAFGKETADQWSDSRLLDKVKDLTDLANDNDEVVQTLSDEDVSTLETIDEANEKDEEITMEGTATPTKKKTTKAPAKAAQAAPAKKPAAKAPAKAAPAKKPSTKKTGGPSGGENFSRAGKNGKPGVMASIKEFLMDASKDDPITRDEIVKKLTKRFPDRPADGMRVTVMAYVPKRLIDRMGHDVRGDKDNGFYMLPDKKVKEEPKEEAAKAPAKKPAKAKAK